MSGFRSSCVLLGAVGLLACGDPIGAPCRFSGSGFTASDNCRYKCIHHWKVRCPDESLLSPMVCSGTPSCEPGSCPADQACYHFDDPTEDRSYCLPANVCGELPAETLRTWELDSDERAAASREAWRKKFPRRSTQVTPDAAVTQPAQPAQPALPPDDGGSR